MRYSTLLLAATGALAQEMHTTLLTIGYTDSAGSAVTATTTYIYEYSNPATSLLTETDSAGLITGNAASYVVTAQPTLVTSQPAVVTSQPDAASIPAGLADGTYTYTQPVGTGNSSFNTFTFTVGSSTTVVLTSSSTKAAATGTGSGSGSDATGTDGSGSSGTGTGTSSSASSSSTGNAAAGLAPVSFGLLSLGSLFAALF